MDIQKIKQKIEREKGKREQIEIELASNKVKQKVKIEKVENVEKAYEIIISIAKKTQDELSFCIENPVNLALENIYGGNVEKFIAKFVSLNKDEKTQKFKSLNSGGTKCELLFLKHGNQFSPIDFGSGGKLDITTFGLMLSSLSLSQPSKRNFLFLDEPFRFVEEDKIDLIGQMLSELCKPPPIGLGLQIIIITHIKEIKKYADNLINLEMINDITRQV